MPVVVGIRFKDSGKVYFFDPNGLEALVQGDAVIVETVRGLELAKVAYSPHHIAEDDIIADLKPVVRRAEDADFERMRLLGERHEEVLIRCAEKVTEHNLPMRLVKAEYSFDGSRLTFYFTAEKRVDFRLLVRDLARTFKTRIELRQIGPRDEAKLLGGIGPCGRLLCCATFLPDYARVSIKMAKDQDLPLNPTKISGVCGRLLCCLSYEHEQYLAIKAELPRRGTWVQTPDGPGEVVAVNVVKETVTVELAGSGVQEEFAPTQITESTRKVSDLARSRTEEGITPAAKHSPREGTHTGERRRLRDEIDNADILDALALLEDTFDDLPQNPRYPETTPSPVPSHRSPMAPREEPPRSRRRNEPPPPTNPPTPPRTPQRPEQREPKRETSRETPSRTMQRDTDPRTPQRETPPATHPPTQPTEQRPNGTDRPPRHRRKRGNHRSGDR